MNISPEKQQLFERLYEKEGEVVRTGQNFLPVELERQEDLTEYRIWRHYAKEVPRMEELSAYCDQLWNGSDQSTVSSNDG